MVVVGSLHIHTYQWYLTYVSHVVPLCVNVGKAGVMLETLKQLVTVVF